MPPKPPPAEDFVSRHEAAVKLETAVDGMLHHAETGLAHDMLASEWERTILPHLPLRYPFALIRIDRRGISRVIELAQDGVEVRFSLHPGLDPHSPEATAVTVPGAAGEPELVGFLDRGSERVLAEAGEHRSLYGVKSLDTIQGVQSGRIRFEMELVRPDLHQCSACGRLHAGRTENCDDCRSKRKRKTKTLEQTQERAPVPLSRAVGRLGSEPDLR